MFAGAGILLVLAGLGLVHAQRIGGRKVEASEIVAEQRQERRAA
jgi:hypothetical protein